MTITQVTTELSTSSGNVGSLSEQTEELQKQVTLEQEEVKKKEAELKVGLIVLSY